MATAAAIREAQKMLEAAASELETELVNHWKAEKDPQLRQEIWAKVNAITLLRTRIDANAKRAIAREG